MVEQIRKFRIPRLILTGIGAVEKVGEEAKKLGVSKALVVSDKGIIKAGLTDKVVETLKREGIAVSIFAEVEIEPSIDNLEACTEVVKKGNYELLVGVGGGSSMDIAKGSAIMALNPGPVSEYFGVDKVPQGGLPTILIPTTAGTGAEATPNAIFTDKKESLKKAIVTPYLFASVAIVDPLMALTCPPRVTAATGMDALIHAIESYTSINATFMTDPLALRAIELISNNLRTAYANGDNLNARARMAEGSLLAGISLTNAGVTAVHAFAYPLGGTYGISHGVSNTLMLPYIMEYNLMGNLEKFAQVAKVMGERIEGFPLGEAAKLSVQAVKRLAQDINVPQKLREVGVPREAIPKLAEGAMKGTRLLANNPRIITLEDAIAIYEQAY